MVDAAEVVDDVVVLRRTAGGGFAAAHVPSRIGIAETVDIGAERRATHGAADGGHGLAAAAAELVAEDATEHAADDGAGHVRVVALLDLLLFHPAALLGRPIHGAHGSDGSVEHAFVRALPVFVRWHGERLRRLVVVVAAVADRPHRRDAVLEPEAAQRVVAAAPQHHAPAPEARVFAHLPVAAVDDD